MTFALFFLCCANLVKHTKKIELYDCWGSSPAGKDKKQHYAFALGLVSFSAFLNFFLSPVSCQTSAVDRFKKVVQSQSWQFSFLLLLCASCLLSTKQLR